MNRITMLLASVVAAARVGKAGVHLSGRSGSLVVDCPPEDRCPAMTPARAAPESAGLSRALLERGSYGIAGKHYTHARTIEAGRDYAALISRLKEKSR